LLVIKVPNLKNEDSLMTKKRKGVSSEKLSEVIVKGMQEKKATDIVVLDLRKVKNAVADFFVICSGNSDKQLDAIADSVDLEVYKALKENPWHTEGKNNKEWMLLDYIDVVAHVFKKERRDFYSLERLWGDADITEIVDNH
jgi:ribosome-associated protein